MGAIKSAARLAVPIAQHHAPAVVTGFVRQAFDHAVDGVGPLKGAAQSAELRLAKHDGDPALAIRDLVDGHVSLAAAQGFVTNIGGVLTLAFTVPANVSGLALLQAHLVGGIAHLRGYDLADPRVRNAVLACMLGGDGVLALVRSHELPSSPMTIATAPVYDPRLDQRIAAHVAAELLQRAAGKRTAAVVGRRTPVIGGGIGLFSDGYSTFRVGRYAARELRSRVR